MLGVMKKYKRFFKPWRVIVYLLVVRIIFSSLLGGKVTLDQTVRLAEWETISKVYKDVGWMDRIKMKRFFRKHDVEVATIQPWAYAFSGSYKFSEILEVFLAGPQVIYEHITVLEGRSSYDVDASLSDKELISAGEYREFITDATIIDRYTQRFAFLAKAKEERWQILSLEWYLYPDTYFVDLSKNIVDQLVFLQLQNFQTKVREPYGTQLTNLPAYLRDIGYDFTLSTYGALTLASIIEKEERVSAQRVPIAGVFYNRLQDSMRIDADISLCYGLARPYSECTPKVIVDNLQDSANLYNTRAVGWLPPTPIGNPTSSSVNALLEATKWPYYYYLHDSTGELHLASNISEHNTNKSKYLNK